MGNKCRISVLNEQTINQIAAGEVVENSGSVVKELVENSIDAGASEVCIETLGGGRGLVRVTDNGSGMNEEELILCLQRHATSKILSSHDLENVGTLGFRGEALPSIASVSKMRLVSAVEIEVDGGRVLSVKPKGIPQGTSIEVRSLFFNVPVRRKFQKSAPADVAEIHKILTRLALCHPSVRFRWINENEERFDLESQSLESRIEALLGEEFVEKEVDAREESLRLYGFVGGHRANRTGQYLFVNGRFVISPLIAQQVLEGCATRLPMHRFPQFVLHLELPREWVDVNVHPQKREVRFREMEKLSTFVRTAVDRALQVKPEPIRLEMAVQPSSFRFEPDDESFFTRPAFFEQEEQLELGPSLHPLGLVGGFLLLAEAEGICVVDLNRTRALLAAEKEEEITQQKLLIPLKLELDESVEEKLPLLEKYGFALRPFGGKSFACDAIPAHLEPDEVQGVIESLLAGRKPVQALKKRRFTIEEGKRLAEELFARGLQNEATRILTEEELAKKFH